MRSVSMQCLSSTNELFSTHKNDLIEELKMSKDIIGIKKMRTERARMEDPKNSEVYNDGQFSIKNFVNTVNVHLNSCFTHINL